MKLFSEFKNFALRGNVIDIAVGIILGAAFVAIVNTLVADVMTPPLGLLIGKVDISNLFIVLKEGSQTGPYATLAEAKAKGAVTLNYGNFLNSIISFFIVALSTFVLIYNVNRFKRKQEGVAPETMECPYCLSKIQVKAVRCPFCTSEIKRQSG